MGKSKRVFAVLLCLTIFLMSTFMSGCSGKKSIVKGKSETISADDVWYEYKEVDIDFGYANLQNMDVLDTVTVGDYAYVVITGTNYVDFSNFTEEDYETFDFSECEFNDIIKVDYDGNVISKTEADFKELMNTDFALLLNTRVEGDLIKFMISDWGGYKFAVVSFDTTTDSFCDYSEFNLPNPDEYNYTDFVPLNDGGWLVQRMNHTYTHCDFCIVRDGEVIKEIKTDTLREGLYHSTGYIVLDNGNVLFTAILEDSGELAFAEINISTYEISLVEDLELDTTAYLFANTINTGATYSFGEDGIHKFDTETYEDVVALSFNNCNFDMARLANPKVLDYTEDRVVLTAMVQKDHYVNSSEPDFEYRLMTLTKTDTNPNAGKTVINVANAGTYCPISFYRAIFEFNESNENYFIRFVSLGNSDIMSSGTEEESVANIANVSEEIKSEVMSATAPDIIFNAANYWQLNSPEYFLDLCGFISGENGIDESRYFNNVINAAKTGDSLYQMPLAFDVRGIAASSEYAPLNGKGYTYDEFTDLIYGPCNGIIPISSDSRIDFFNNNLSIMSDLFIDYEGGKVDFSNEDFYSFARFCKDNIPEEGFTEEELYNKLLLQGMVIPSGLLSNVKVNDEMPSALSLYGIGDYANLITGTSDAGLYGLSCDGRGPAISIPFSVAITACSANPDGSWEFIKYLLSDNVQSNLSYDYVNPINIDSVRNASMVAIAEMNEAYESNENTVEMYAMSLGELYGKGIYNLDESAIEPYIELLKTAEYVIGNDYEVVSIIDEEVSAYFSGQKSIEEVASIINDRAQTVFDERG